VAFVGVLASAPVKPYFAEWRSVQKEYNRLAIAAGLAPIAIEVKQIWKPALGVTDRCTTCHLGMGPGSAPIVGHATFGAHPAIPHDPREFGCTVCHGGQGRATSKDAAHGFVSHWDEQILEKGHLAAGCGTCHDQFPTAPRAVLAEGARRIEQLDCLSCHRVDGRGRGDAPDLSYVGLRGFDAEWPAKHLAKHEAAANEAWRSSFGPIAQPDLSTIDLFLKTRVGAPRVVEARAVAMERGCLGCHKLGGIGGDEGPALDAVGRKPAGDFNFARVPGAPTTINYMRAHLIDPARVFPGSTMVAQEYTPDEIELLTSWILFLRSRDVPAAFLPKDRVRRAILNEPRPSLPPDQTFGAFCAACHGAEGQGHSYGNSEARFPAIGSPDFLNVASDEFIVSTLRTGRPNRRMPALAAPGATLDDAAVTGIVAYLRGRLGVAPSQASLGAIPADIAVGVQTYRDDCAACHGDAGEGTSLGPPLAAADRPLSDERAYTATVHGVPGTAMPAYADRPPAALAAVLRFMKTLPRTGTSRAAWSLGTGNAADGAALYGSTCAGCHGAAGEGKVGPALANPAFRQAATTAFIGATVVRGRAGTPMPSFGRDSAVHPRLTAREVLDVAAFVRDQLGRTPPVQGAH
jgi:mono/diheme cytochrome c family protein